jgi:hypothetical protein
MRRKEQKIIFENIMAELPKLDENSKLRYFRSSLYPSWKKHGKK